VDKASVGLQLSPWLSADDNLGVKDYRKISSKG